PTEYLDVEPGQAAVTLATGPARCDRADMAPHRDTRLVASANVELVRSIYAAWGRGDYRSTVGSKLGPAQFARAAHRIGAESRPRSGVPTPGRLLPRRPRVSGARKRHTRARRSRLDAAARNQRQAAKEGRWIFQRSCHRASGTQPRRRSEPRRRPRLRPATLSPPNAGACRVC